MFQNSKYYLVNKEIHFQILSGLDNKIRQYQPEFQRDLKRLRNSQLKCANEFSVTFTKEINNLLTFEDRRKVKISQNKS